MPVMAAPAEGRPHAELENRAPGQPSASALGRLDTAPVWQRGKGPSSLSYAAGPAPNRAAQQSASSHSIPGPAALFSGFYGTEAQRQPKRVRRQSDGASGQQPGATTSDSALASKPSAAFDAPLGADAAAAALEASFAASERRSAPRSAGRGSHFSPHISSDGSSGTGSGGWGGTTLQRRMPGTARQECRKSAPDALQPQLQHQRQLQQPQHPSRQTAEPSALTPPAPPPWRSLSAPPHPARALKSRHRNPAGSHSSCHSGGPSGRQRAAPPAQPAQLSCLQGGPTAAAAPAPPADHPAQVPTAVLAAVPAPAAAQQPRPPLQDVTNRVFSPATECLQPGPNEQQPQKRRQQQHNAPATGAAKSTDPPPPLLPCIELGERRQSGVLSEVSADADAAVAEAAAAAEAKFATAGKHGVGPHPTPASQPAESQPPPPQQQQQQQQQAALGAAAACVKRRRGAAAAPVHQAADITWNVLGLSLPATETSSTPVASAASLDLGAVGSARGMLSAAAAAGFTASPGANGPSDRPPLQGLLDEWRNPVRESSVPGVSAGKRGGDRMTQ